MWCAASSSYWRYWPTCAGSPRGGCCTAAGGHCPSGPSPPPCSPRPRPCRCPWPCCCWMATRSGGRGAAGGLALLVLPQAGAVTGYAQYGPAARLGMVGYSLGFYPLKFLWPVGLSPLYELPARVALTDWRFAGPLLAVSTVTGLLLWARRRWPAGLAAWTYSALLVLPVSGLVHSGHQLAHDRYSYLSGLGFALLGGGAAAWVAAAWRSGRLRSAPAAALGLVFVLVLAGWGAGSWRQSKVWRDTETLFRWAVEVEPECATCSQNLAAQILYDSPGDPARVREAEAYVRRAISLRPDLAPAHYDLGLALAAQRR